MRAKRARLSRHNDASRAMDHMLNRWPACVRFLDDSRIYLTNNHTALGLKSLLFAGSDRGGIRAADVYTLIITANLNDVDACAGLADVLHHIADQPARNLADLLPWNWSKPLAQEAAAA